MGVVGGKRSLLRLAVVVVACVVVGAALFAFDSATQPDVYETHADLALNPVAPAALYDDEVLAVPDDEAIAGELEFARSDPVTTAIDAEVDYDEGFTWSIVDDTTLRVSTRATSPELAVAAASSAGAIYGRVRMEAAQQAVDPVIADLQAQVPTLTGEEQAAAQFELDRANDARTAIDTGTAFVVETPETPADPTTDTGGAAAKGALVGLVAGLVISAVIVVETRLRRRSADQSAIAGEARLGEIARDETADEGDATAGPGDDASASDEGRRAAEATVADSSGTDKVGSPLGSVRSWIAARPWLAPAGIVALVVARSAVYIALGPRLILDDYIHLYGSRFLGVLETSQQSINRPGAWVTQTVLFSVAGQRPLLVFILLSLLNVGAALALYFAVARFFPRPLPFLVAGLWVLMANHSTLTVWAAAGQGVVALALCFCGVNLLSRGRWIGALILFSASILSYELAVGLCFVAAVVVGTPLARPLDRTSVVRAVRPWQRAVMVAVLGVVVWWMSRNPLHPLEPTDFNAWDTWAGHVSSGLVATDNVSTLLLRFLEVAVALGLVACVIAWLRGDRSRRTGPLLAIAGAAVMGLGLTLVVAVPGGLFGLGNRLYGLSSVGAAMIVVGIGVLLWQHLRTAAVVGALAFVAIAAAGQFIALRAAHEAGDDAVALIRYLDTAAEQPENTSFLVEPRPQHNGFYAIDNLFDLYAYQLAYPHAQGELVIASTQEEFQAPAPGQVTITWAQVRGEEPVP